METAQEQKNETGKVIRVHPELIDVLEKFRLRLNKATYGVIYEKASYYDLTGILARKIKGKV